MYMNFDRNLTEFRSVKDSSGSVGRRSNLSTPLILHWAPEELSHEVLAAASVRWAPSPGAGCASSSTVPPSFLRPTPGRPGRSWSSRARRARAPTPASRPGSARRRTRYSVSPRLRTRLNDIEYYSNIELGSV